jgi:carbon-monoxide dehydrogenase large subunit
VKNAALEIREKLLETVARGRQRDAADLYLENEHVRSRADAAFFVPFCEFVIDGLMQPDGRFIGGPIHGTGAFMPEFTSALGDPETSQGGRPNVHYTVGCAGVTLEVDRETGKIKVLKAVLAIDAGKVINPSLVKGQIVGGVVQGLATALYEDIRYAPNGRLLNPNFTNYKLPTSQDCPLEIVPIMLESPQPDGPFGARGVGEHTMIAAAPMVADAIENAVGVRLQTMPLTAEKVALALHEIDYEAVKGPSTGFCFRGHPRDYPFVLPVEK